VNLLPLLIIGRRSKPEKCSTYLSFASSGTAWGYGLNGLLILLVVPTLGWQSRWPIAALVGLVVVLFIWRRLTKLNRQPSTHTIPVQAMIPALNYFLPLSENVPHSLPAL